MLAKQWWLVSIVLAVVAHGESPGNRCTYGFFEKRDLHRRIDRIEGGPIVLIGTSLGAAVALQEAAMDSRIAAGAQEGSAAAGTEQRMAVR